VRLFCSPQFTRHESRGLERAYSVDRRPPPPRASPAVANKKVALSPLGRSEYEKSRSGCGEHKIRLFFVI